MCTSRAGTPRSASTPAALLATGRAPGLARPFACERWADFDLRALTEMRAQAAARIRAASARIVASDHDARAVAATRHNARAADVHEAVAIERRDARTLALPDEGWLVVSNPPYGVRVGSGGELPALYRSFGDALKRACVGSTAWLLVGNSALVKEVGLRPSRRIVLFNGPIECRLLRYDLFAGSRRDVRGDSQSPV
jgi:putative N6-adenine-specific DNA methylase